VLAVATTNVAALSGPQVVDTVPLVAGDRVLLAAQTTATQNGIWVVQAGAWTRPADWVTGSTHAAGEQIQIAPGSPNFDRFGATWVCTAGGVVDTASTVFYPRFDKGQVTLDGAGTASLTDRWIFGTGSEATANDTTLGGAAERAVDVVEVLPGASTGTLSLEGTANRVIAFVIVNF
jgi:hypothetical protein